MARAAALAGVSISILLKIPPSLNKSLETRINTSVFGDERFSESLPNLSLIPPSISQHHPNFNILRKNENNWGKHLQAAIFFCTFAFENAKLLTLGNWCKHHCSRLIAALHQKRTLWKARQKPDLRRKTKGRG